MDGVDEELAESRYKSEVESLRASLAAMTAERDAVNKLNRALLVDFDRACKELDGWQVRAEKAEAALAEDRTAFEKDLGRHIRERDEAESKLVALAFAARDRVSTTGDAKLTRLVDDVLKEEEG